MVNHELSKERLRQRGLLQPATAVRMIDENETAQRDRRQRSWALLSLERWQQAFLDSPALAATATSSGRGSRPRMRVWVDLDNSPHVLFFTPIIRRLEREGVEVVITVRSFSQTEELASAHGLKFETIGEHKTPGHFFTRAAATVHRAFQLATYVRGLHPDVAMSHGSRALVLAAWILGIPSMTLYDYEFISSRVFNQMSTRILVPSVISPETLRRQGLEMRKFTPYPGLKEEVYIYDFQPDSSVLDTLGLDSSKLIITVRPPGEWAHYHNERSELLFRTLVERLRLTENAQVVVLPRTQEQKKNLIHKYGMGSKPFRIAEQAVDGLSLMWHSDAVFSGGGTMVREAALLGVDVYSIFAGKLGSADQALASAARLKLIRQPEEIQHLSFDKHTRTHLHPKGNGETREFIYQQILDFTRVCSRAESSCLRA